MKNKLFTWSLIIIGILCILLSTNVNAQAVNTNMTISNPTLILLFSFFLLSFGIYKEDHIIGFLCCFGSAFIFLASWYNELYDASLNPYIIVIVVVALGVGVYKVFLEIDNPTHKQKE